MRVLVRRLRSALGKPIFVLLWLIPVWLLLNLCRLLIKAVSFRRLAALLGVASGSQASIPLVTEAQRRRASKIGQVVRLAARYVPWGANCYPQALAACLLLFLHRVPYCLCFGVARDPQGGRFSAHAWTAAGNVRVVGGESFSRFAVIACFVSMQGSVGGKRGRDATDHHRALSPVRVRDSAHDPASENGTKSP
jgi:hypothetical protein